VTYLQDGANMQREQKYKGCMMIRRLLARATINYWTVRIGSYSSAELAAQAYNEFMLLRQGEHALLK